MFFNEIVAMFTSPTKRILLRRIKIVKSQAQFRGNVSIAMSATHFETTLTTVDYFETFNYKCFSDHL